MKILWMSWKDRQHPRAGGAEVVNEEIAKRLARDGHEVIFLVGGFKGCLSEEKIDGYKVVRLGNRWSVYWKAYRYYKKNLRGWADLAIDEMNTVPFFCKFYVYPVKSLKKGAAPPLFNGVKERNILLVYQLCREIWFYEMVFPLNVLGYLLEPIYLWLLRDRHVITISASTKKDLTRFGFKNENIRIINVGIELEPVHNLEPADKFEKPTLLSFGAMRAMKRADHIVAAFEIAKKEIPNLQLVVAGSADGKYGKKVLQMIKKSRYRDDIRYWGLVGKDHKTELMRKSRVLCVASIKEGWGLTVTEAASQGTPAVVYNADGLRDSVNNGETGIVCEANTPENMAENIVKLLKNREEYDRLRKNAWEWSRGITFEKSYQQFARIVSLR